jgi:hypothetical protein
VCRKLSIGLILVMPQVMDLGDKVLLDFKNIIVGQFRGDNALKIKKAMGYDRRSNVIPYLEFNRFLEKRELLYYNKDFNTFFTFRAFNCPSEIHREGQKIKSLPAPPKDRSGR